MTWQDVKGTKMVVPSVEHVDFGDVLKGRRFQLVLMNLYLRKKAIPTHGLLS